MIQEEERATTTRSAMSSPSELKEIILADFARVRAFVNCDMRPLFVTFDKNKMFVTKLGQRTLRRRVRWDEHVAMHGTTGHCRWNGAIVAWMLHLGGVCPLCEFEDGSGLL